MKLTGLDFETANGKNGSICAAGCAVLENGVVTERHEWLIYPHEGYRWMRPDFTDIHGIHYWDVCKCQELPAVWPEMQRMLLAADCVVIHNAPFDLRHLRSVLELYELPPVASLILAPLTNSTSKASSPSDFVMLKPSSGFLLPCGYPAGPNLIMERTNR